MTWLIDAIAVAGGSLIVGGVFIQFGLAPCMITGGVLMICLALRSAKVHEDSNAANSK